MGCNIPVTRSAYVYIQYIKRKWVEDLKCSLETFDWTNDAMEKLGGLTIREVG